MLFIFAFIVFILEITNEYNTAKKKQKKTNKQKIISLKGGVQNILLNNLALNESNLPGVWQTTGNIHL